MEATNKRAGAQAAEPGRLQRWWRNAVPTLVISVSLAASFYGHALLRDRALERSYTQLRLDGAALIDNIQDRAARAEYFLQAVSALFEASQSVTAEEFASFTTKVHASAGIIAADFIGFVPAAPRAGRRTLGYVSEFNGPQAARIAMLQSAPAWNELLLQAARDRRMISSPLHAWPGAEQPGEARVVLVNAVADGENPSQLGGFVVLVFDLARAVTRAHEASRSSMGMRLRPDTEGAPAALERNGDKPPVQGIELSTELALLQTPWRIDTWSIENAEMAGDAFLAKVALVLGLAISLMLFFATLSLKRARTAADSSRKQLFDAMESMTDAFAVYDQEDRLAAWNSKYLESYPLSHGEIRLGRRYEDILRAGIALGEYPDCPAEPREAKEAWLLQRLDRHMAADTHMEQQLSDGRWLRISEFRTSEGGIAVLRRDITDAKRHETLLTTQLRILERLTRGGRLADQLHEVLRWIEGHVRGAKASIHRLDAGSRRFASTLSDSLPKAYTDQLDGIEIGDNVGSCGTAAFRRATVISSDIATDRHWRDFSYLTEPFGLKACWSTPILGETGQVHGTLAVYFDTPRVPEEIELQMLGIASNLARLALEREAYLGRLTSLAKMDAVDRLSGGIAHDFNNLLQVIEQSTALLRENLHDERQRLLADLSLEAARKGAALTQRLLVFARGQPLQLGGLDITDAIQGMLPLLQQACGGDIDLTLSLQESLPSVNTDRILLESALLNLAINARDAMPDGGKLHIATSLEHFSEHDAATGLEPGSYVAIRMRDTGVGMDAETLRNAIVPYFTTKPVGRGSGLGLSMVYGFTRENHGALLLQSQPNAGTVVSIYLPLSSG